MNREPETKSVCFITLGCAKNEVDSNRMQALVNASGVLHCVDEPQDADVIVVNTCSFLVSAVEEGIEVTLSLVSDRVDPKRPCPIVMTGCIPSRYGDGITSEMPEVAAFVPVDDEGSIVDVLVRVLKIETVPESKPAVERIGGSPCAYVKISDGCDRYCSFCAIPYIRGRYYSRPESLILDEVSYLVSTGVREIVLIGQDTGVWGCDLPGKPTVSHLLREVARLLEPVNGLVRILYLQPEGLSDELVETIRDVPQVAKYIDIPLQHASASVLARMNRTGSSEEFSAMVERLRREIPGITLRTTAMVGFPGETEEEFQELLAFLDKASFDYCAVFAYSQEEGTAAADLPGQVPEETKLAREQQVIDLTEACGFASAERHVGTTQRVLIDAVEDDGNGGTEFIGRAAFQAPDSDGVVHLGGHEVAFGTFVDVVIDDAACYELFAHPVSEGDAAHDGR